MNSSELPPSETGGLINRNLTVNGRRTSIRLEPEMFDALEEIAKREDARVSDVVSRIDLDARQSGSGVLGYFRAAATEEGHRNAGHGLFYGREVRR